MNTPEAIKTYEETLAKMRLDPQARMEAFRWMKKEAENGNSVSQLFLSQIYLEGSDIVPQDYAEAEKWCQLAAEQGNKSAIESLPLIQEIQKSAESETKLKKKNTMKKINLNHKEIIIISIVIGVLIALIFGSIFTKEYDIINGIKVYGEHFEYSEFNYLLAFCSLIIVSGISYLYLIRKCNSNKENNIVED
jgi:TPR repeat protein